MLMKVAAIKLKFPNVVSEKWLLSRDHIRSCVEDEKERDEYQRTAFFSARAAKIHRSWLYKVAPLGVALSSASRSIRILELLMVRGQ